MLFSLWLAAADAALELPSAGACEGVGASMPRRSARESHLQNEGFDDSGHLEFEGETGMSPAEAGRAKSRSLLTQTSSTRVLNDGTRLTLPEHIVCTML